MRPWIVQGRNAWCVAKDQTVRPDSGAMSIATLCDHVIMLPWGVRRGLTDCAACRRAMVHRSEDTKEKR